MCSKARIACWITLGRNFCSRLALDTMPSAFDAPFSEVLPVVDAGGEALLTCSRTRYRSYSLLARRRNSRTMTRRMTTMHEPANMPWEVMCQVLERKPSRQGVSISDRKFLYCTVCTKKLGRRKNGRNVLTHSSEGPLTGVNGIPVPQHLSPQTSQSFNTQCQASRLRPRDEPTEILQELPPPMLMPPMLLPEAVAMAAAPVAVLDIISIPPVELDGISIFMLRCQWVIRQLMQIGYECFVSLKKRFRTLELSERNSSGLRNAEVAVKSFHVDISCGRPHFVVELGMSRLWGCCAHLSKFSLLGDDGNPNAAIAISNSCGIQSVFISRLSSLCKVMTYEPRAVRSYQYRESCAV